MSLATLSDADQFRALTTREQERRLAQLSDEEAEELLYDWDFWARSSQKMPPIDAVPGGWVYWFVMAGRGFGKTRIGAETVRVWVRDFPLVNLVGPTSDDIRDVMIEGESGILAICPKNERPLYQTSKRRLLWPNGAISLLFTADEPERLRGKQHMKVWADEIAAWRYADSWDQLQFGLRLGTQPQCVITSTPKPTKLVKEIAKDKRTIVTRGTTYENKANLAQVFLEKIVTKYEGTRLGRQELNAELLKDNPGALWQQDQIEATRVSMLPNDVIRGVVGVDPSTTSKETSDEWGLIVAFRDARSPAHYYVVEDASNIYTPDQAAGAVDVQYKKHALDRVVAETNQGGDMVETVMRHKNANIPYKGVHASKGKVTRAEPISAMYEQGRVHHVGIFAVLESEMTDYNPLTSTDSPNRMDALVWALTDLSEGGHGLLDSMREEHKRRGEQKEATSDDKNAKRDEVAQDTASLSAAQKKQEKTGFMEKLGSKIATNSMNKIAKAIQQTDLCPKCNANVSRGREDKRTIWWKCNSCGERGTEAG